MGHMNVVENYDPQGRKSCYKHDEFDAFCLGCFIANGGGND